MRDVDLGALEIRAEVRDGLVSLVTIGEIPKLLEDELVRSIALLNLHVSSGAVEISDVDMSPLIWSATDDVEARGKPCNANRFETKWWGLKVWASRDVLYGAAAGDVAATGIAAVFGGGPLAILIGGSILVHIGILIACCGDCGVEFDLTWAGVAKKIRKRK